MQPTFRIGITGHRPNRMHVGVARIQRQLFVILRSLAKTARGQALPRVPVDVSALAEGSDRLFALAALRLRIPLRVLLPFKAADYETTFCDAAATHQFRELLSKAESVRELPGSLGKRTAGFEEVGRATVDTCDVLIAVWDGKPAAGHGGTAEVVGYAVRIGRMVIWIDAANKRHPRMLSRESKPINAIGEKSLSISRRYLTSRVLRAEVRRCSRRA